MSTALASLPLSAHVLFLWLPKFSVEPLPSILSEEEEEKREEEEEKGEEESVNDNAEGDDGVSDGLRLMV